MSPRKVAKKAVKSAVRSGKEPGGFTEAERAAMKERVEELRAGKADGEGALLAKLAAMPEPDRALGTRLHALIKASAPGLSPRTWYGMPAYAKGDKVVCFFQGASKFKARYATLGFSDEARLDDGAMWPTSFALKQLGAAEEERVSVLVKRAAGVEAAG